MKGQGTVDNVFWPPDFMKNEIFKFDLIFMILYRIGYKLSVTI